MNNWKSLQTVIMTGEMKTIGGFDNDVAFYKKRPDKNKVILKIMGKKIVQSYDGKDAWWINPSQGADTAAIVPDDVANRMKNFRFDDDLLDYVANESSVELNGSENILGNEVYKIHLTKKD